MRSPNPEHPAARQARGVALLFPGQGAQQPRMAAGLYAEHARFRALMDEVFEAWGAEGDALRADWLSDAPAVDPDDVRRAQPLLFAVDRALGQMVLDWGVRPVALLGHSVGEVAAATLSGVLTLEEAVAVMAARVEHIRDAPEGGMLAVQSSADEVAPFLRDEVVVGVVNGPRQVVLAGPRAPLAETGEELRGKGFTCMRTRALSPFHSPALAPAAARALPGVARLPLRAPLLPLWSGYTAAPMTEQEAVDPEFWARQPAAPVLFGPALEALLATGDLLLLEAGPGQGLTSLARRRPRVARGGSDAYGLLPARAGKEGADPAAVRAVAERLLAEGHLDPARAAVTDVLGTGAAGPC